MIFAKKKPDYTFFYRPQNLRETLIYSKWAIPTSIFCALVGAGVIGVGIGYEQSVFCGVGSAIEGLEVLVLFIIAATKKKPPASSCKIQFRTHNVGTTLDCIDRIPGRPEKQWFQEGMLHINVEERRLGLFQQSLKEDHSLGDSIICLQETSDTFYPLSLKKITSHRFYFGHGGLHFFDTAIGWDKSKFTKIGYGGISFPIIIDLLHTQLKIPSLLPNLKKKQLEVSFFTTLVLLKHKKTGRRILVASAHIYGFHVDCLKNPQKYSREALKNRDFEIQQGNEQMKYIALILPQLAKKYHADVVMMGMNAGADKATCPERFDVLENLGYQFDYEMFQGFTFMDATCAPMKMDHIAFWPGQGKGKFSKSYLPSKLSRYDSPDSFCNHSSLTYEISLSP